MTINQIMAFIVSIALALCISFVIGQRVGMHIIRNNFACHSISEDSPPNDCDFYRIDPDRGIWRK